MFKYDFFEDKNLSIIVAIVYYMVIYCQAPPKTMFLHSNLPPTVREVQGICLASGSYGNKTTACRTLLLVARHLPAAPTSGWPRVTIYGATVSGGQKGAGSPAIHWSEAY